MAIKKQQDKLKTVYFGRPGNNLKMGIVGLPNVGKSTFFNVLTKSATAAENYPFCTLDPEESRAPVPDERFDWLCETYKPIKKIPAYLTVIDIAGLVKNASTGEGLGNMFLSHIRAVDGIFHMVRAFSDNEVIHVEGDVNPVRDIEIIHKELRLKDAELLKKAVETAISGLRGSHNDKNKIFELDTLKKALEHVENGKDIQNCEWSQAEIPVLNKYQLLTAKRMVYLVNVSEKDYRKKKNKWILSIKEWVDKNNPGSIIVPYSASYELSLLHNEKQKDPDAPPSAMDKIIVSGYSILNLIRFFTAGPDEVRAWTIRNGTKSPQAAGVIHTDFEKNFIAAEIMEFEDLKKYGSESAVKAAGKYQLKGKDYIVKDNDIIYFKANPSSKKK